MIEAEEFLLSVYCKAKLDDLPEEQLREHADLLIERLKDTLKYMPKVELRDPWKLSLASKLAHMLTHLEYEA